MLDDLYCCEGGEPTCKADSRWNENDLYHPLLCSQCNKLFLNYLIHDFLEVLGVTCTGFTSKGEVLKLHSSLTKMHFGDCESSNYKMYVHTCIFFCKFQALQLII